MLTLFLLSTTIFLQLSHLHLTEIMFVLKTSFLFQILAKK